jgi:hypothetical protein
VKPGELVVIKRNGIGVQRGAIALIIEKRLIRTDLSRELTSPLYTVSIIGRPHQPRRYLERDIEVISEGR